MPLARLRRILGSQLVVRAVSSDNLVEKVQEEVAARRQQLLEKNKPAPIFKPVVRVAQFDGMAWQVRPIRLLHKIGRMTTPSGLANMARLSAGWATRRYFWAIAEASDNNQRFRLSNDALGLDFHQKGLLSDEFGIGMAGLFMEEHLGIAESMDISLALGDALLAQQIEQSGRTQPDYIMWNGQPNPNYYLVECKGCQSGADASLYQLRRGLEQLPSITFADPARHAGSFVIATNLSGAETILYIIDPPDEDEPSSRFRGDRASERTGGQLKVTDMAALERRSRIEKAVQILQWAGQNHRALAARAQLEALPDIGALPDLPMEARKIAGAEYHGQVMPLFPELSTDLKVFLGVDQRLLAAAERQGEIPFDALQAGAQRPVAEPEPAATDSVLLDGTCMSIEGLPL